MEKKGSASDLPLLMVGIFGIAVVALMVSLVLYHLNTSIQANTAFDADSKAAMNKMSTDFPVTINSSIIFIFFALCIISFILASMVSVHPAWFIAFLLEWLLVIWIGGGIANTYELLIDSAPLAPIAAQFAQTTFFFRYLPYVIGVVGAILASVMYKARDSVGYGG